MYSNVTHLKMYLVASTAVVRSIDRYVCQILLDDCRVFRFSKAGRVLPRDAKEPRDVQDLKRQGQDANANNHRVCDAYKGHWIGVEFHDGRYAME